MIENSYLSDRMVSKSLIRLNKISSDKRFRVKSLRTKTQQKQFKLQSPVKKNLNFRSVINQDSQLTSGKSLTQLTTSPSCQLSSFLINKKLRIKSTLLQKDYQNLLASKFNIPAFVLKKIFTLKLQYQKIKPNQQKYHQFCKKFYLRLIDKLEVNVEQFNLRGKALYQFLNFWLKWKQGKTAIGLDLSFCSQLAYDIKSKEEQQEGQINRNRKGNSLIKKAQTGQNLWPTGSILPRVILQDQRLIKISLKNTHLSPQQMIDVLTCCLKSKRIYSLDISNKNSQTINRVGSQHSYIQAFFAKNQFIGVIKMENLNITDQCVQKISSGIQSNGAKNNPLKIFSLANNPLTQRSRNSVEKLLKSGITDLNLSNNPLGPQFFMQISNLRSNLVRSLNLSSVNMNSQSLIHFLEQVSQNKNLQILKLDDNDFSHHWFNKIKDVFDSGLSVQSLSLANCGIKNFDVLFQALQNNKSLLRLNLNYNLVNIGQQNIQKVIQFFQNNKTLQNLYLRFSGYKQQTLMRIFAALKLKNRALKLLDVSQNHLSDKGGKQVIKMLQENKIIEQIVCEKLQMTVRMNEEITKVVRFNREAREKKDFHKLIDQNKVIKGSDVSSWGDLDKLNVFKTKLDLLINQSMTIKQKVQKKIQVKKQSIINMRKQFRQAQRKYEIQIKRQQQKLNSLIQKTNIQLQRIQQKQTPSKQALQIQENLINILEKKIMKQNQKIKKKQNQLEEQLRDQKYLAKKQEEKKNEQNSLRGNKQEIKYQSNKEKNKSKIFNNTKGILPRKKKQSLTQKKS